MANQEVVLYTRSGCHLCENAKRLLDKYGLEPAEIDIESDPALLERYGTSIPVIVIDGRLRFRGRVEERLLRRILADRDRR